MAKKLTRTEMRENLYQALFRMDYFSGEELPEQMELFLDEITATNREKEELRERFQAVVTRVEDLDTLIEEKSNGWKVQRLAKSDLTILRLAIYEMRYDDKIPVGVAISEAVELAKNYGGEKSAGFVNGVLSTIAKELSARKDIVEG